ncbi:hypothetical protein BD289DRAFT_225268 [Coniella lustricola]|uniref:Uncharacterized protein n=1 Tax=Coniella lustricola TaxID=2025994 RepID=A0A2T3AAR7_9PEZI|nr:hypothetical protein BD289DRAFT_225268 [Coniella lustricola]
MQYSGNLALRSSTAWVLPQHPSLAVDMAGSQVAFWYWTGFPKMIRIQSRSGFPATNKSHYDFSARKSFPRTPRTSVRGQSEMNTPKYNKMVQSIPMQAIARIGPLSGSRHLSVLPGCKIWWSGLSKP